MSLSHQQFVKLAMYSRKNLVGTWQVGTPRSFPTRHQLDSCDIARAKTNANGCNADEGLNLANLEDVKLGPSSFRSQGIRCHFYDTD
ncbi:hypothetical protein CC1G_07061 [Coprinopsis cinerea okayama7|uniref:Uncharacterized protein n=1 Tax=Coprinopsis cinerea (strain Okayama-7 / 130 / ATCC MYA-4618 / FGSC 9003) TaxID=240176 RepID=A8NUA7_COPC7|nr:hypothetical protein CC1G_07061 [Coprinopsis cinerea okayama7\|eukprot:XP_001836414.2 hypothetical protein CC1G_07061 [Coprinopsis cinerea okayama7\